MSSNKSDDLVQKVLDYQSMIEITAKSLDGLRKQCTQTNDLIQNEILEKESKIIELFSRQLVAKARLKVDKMPESLRAYPNLEQLLSIIGINHRSIQKRSKLEEARKAQQATAKDFKTLCLMAKDMSVEDLLEMLGMQNDKPIAQLMTLNHANEEEIKRLQTALYKLRKCTEVQLQDRKHSKRRHVDLGYSWTNYPAAISSGSPYGGNSPKLLHHPRPSTSSLHDSYPPQSPMSPPTPPDSPAPTPVHTPSPGEQRKGKYTPPPTPPLVKVQGKGKFPTTPPPQKKNKLHPEAFHTGALPKSKSHDSQLPCRVNTDSKDNSKYMKKKPADLSLQESAVTSPRKKSVDLLSGNSSPLLPSPKKSPPYHQKHDSVSLCDSGIVDMHPSKKNQLLVPPVSPRSMMHSISHRLARKACTESCELCSKQKKCKFQTNFVMGACDMCNKHVIFGKVCKYCKAKFHKDCASRTAPACGLPNELLHVFTETIKHEGSPGRAVNSSISLPYQNELVHARSVPAFPDHGRSGSTTSSCTSSTPSSPAPFLACPSPLSSAHASPHIIVTPNTHTQFNFPDVNVITSVDSSSSFPVTASTDSSIDSPPPHPPNNADVINTNTSNDSDKSDKTLIDTGSSSDKALPPLDRVDSIESTEDGLQSLNRVNSISVTLREWDIPYESLKFGEAIGEGRFGTVYKGNWHGDVAIKMLKMDPTLDNQSQLQSFKLEVAMLRKTRHENLVLFMGACMKPPRLAIVTSLCRGKPLYTCLHVEKAKYNLNRAVIIASQISQGMGYLHAKDIIHKDLKSRNVFLEQGKVVITDFGLFSVTKLCHGTRAGNWLSTPPEWLCYLAPEVMRKLTPLSINADLPFSNHSDVYAFGTIWYEIIAGEFPFKRVAPEVVIWQVGSGIKQPLNFSTQASKDVKDLLMMCWHYSPSERPDFKKLMQCLEKLPKKRLARSPSHPVHLLSRSAESVF